MCSCLLFPRLDDSRTLVGLGLVISYQTQMVTKLNYSCSWYL